MKVGSPVCVLVEHPGSSDAVEKQKYRMKFIIFICMSILGQ